MLKPHNCKAKMRLSSAKMLFVLFFSPSPDIKIKSERYLNPEEKKLEDERLRLEKEKLLDATVQTQL